ncbi:hypothetical protein H4R35_007646, partial [Dimargaris xerosporica]
LSTNAQLAITFGVLAHQVVARVIPQIPENAVLAPGKQYTVNWTPDPEAPSDAPLKLSLLDNNNQVIELPGSYKMNDGQATVMIPPNVGPAPAFAFTSGGGTDYSFRLDGQGGQSFEAQTVSPQGQTQQVIETTPQSKPQNVNKLSQETLTATQLSQPTQGIDLRVTEDSNDPLVMESNTPARGNKLPPRTSDSNFPHDQSTLPRPSTKDRVLANPNSIDLGDPELEAVMGRNVDGLLKDGAKNSTSSSRNSTKSSKDDNEDTKMSSKRNKTESVNKTKDHEDSSDAKTSDKNGTQTLLPSMLYAVVATGITYTLMGSL